MDEGLEKDADGFAGLVAAVRAESVERLARSMKTWAGPLAEVEFVDGVGSRRRPLDMAAGAHWMAGVRVLLDAGCPAGGRTSEEQSWSAAERAVFSVGMASSANGGANADDAWRVLGMLRDAGEDLSKADERGITLLMLSAGRLGVDQVMELSEVSNIHARDFAGDGVLHYAVGRGRGPCDLPLRLMERWELDPHAKNRDARSAVDCAVEDGWPGTAGAMEAKWMEIVAKKEAAQISKAIGAALGVGPKGPRRV